MLKGGKFTDLYIYESLLFHAERDLLKAGLLVISCLGWSPSLAKLIRLVCIDGFYRSTFLDVQAGNPAS